jgi:hypothetical protein
MGRKVRNKPVKKDIHFLGHISTAFEANTSAEWFPSFNYFFIKNYLKKHFNVVSHKFVDNQYWKKVENLNLKLEDYRTHPNVVTYILPSESKAIIFTTYWNTCELYNHIKSIFKEYDTVVYSGHYNKKLLLNEWKGDISKIKPWLFRPLRWERPEVTYNPELSKLYFRGLFISGPRSVLNNLIKIDNEEIDIKFNTRDLDYFDKCSQAKLSLSLSGIRDICNRDIEFWSRGIPSIRPKFSCNLAVDIPEDVYIPVEFEGKPSGFGIKPNDNEKLCKSIVDKYNEVKNNTKLLNQVSKNAREFYNSNFTPEKISEFSLKLLTNHFNYEQK